MSFLSGSMSSFSIGLLLCGVVAFAGCATEAAKRSESSRLDGTATGQSAARALPQKPVASSDVAPSSLEALRQGKAAVDGPMKSIYFNFDSYELSADSRAVLKANAAWLKANPSSMVEIEGHCDERGTTEYNLALGAKRARAAMDYLISLGVNPSRMKTLSYGEELPICREATEACYLENRRARFLEIRPRPVS